MAAAGLSRESLAAHNRAMRQRRTTAAPQHRRDRSPRRDGFTRQMTTMSSRVSDKDSVQSSSIVERASSRHSITSLIRTKRKSHKWKQGKMHLISMNDKDKSKGSTYENTFITEPDTVFSTRKTKDVLESVLEENFDTMDTYDPIRCAVLSRTLSETIKTRIKALDFPRYKIVASVVIGQNTGQALNIASQGVWNTSTDTMVTAVYEKKDFFVVATAFGTYFE